MTTIQVHLLMLGVALLAFLFLAGPLGNRKSLSHRLRRQWWSGLIVTFAVALSPLSRFWRSPVNGVDLLTQSLLVSAIILLTLMLFSLLRRPLKAMFKGRKKNHNEIDTAPSTAAQLNAAQRPGVTAASNSTPILINADGSSSVQNSAQNASATIQPAGNATDDAFARSMHNPVTRVRNKTKSLDEQLVEPNKSERNDGVQAFAADNNKAPNNANNDNLNTNDFDDILSSSTDASTQNTTRSTDKAQNEETVASIDKSLNLSTNNDQSNTRRLDPTDIESVMQRQAKNDGTRQMGNNFSQSNAANDNKRQGKSLNIKIDAEEPMADIPSAMDEDSLDLSETEQLFAELRQQKTEVHLPNEDELRQAKADSTMDELDFDTDLIQDSDNRITTGSPNKIELVEEEIIEEAEVVELGDSSLAFGNDLTGEYSHPDVVTSAPSDATLDKSVRPEKEVHVPETLDAAIIAAKASALSLQSQVSSLEESITELDDWRDSTMDATVEAAAIRAEHSDALLRQKDDLLRTENEARIAAESLIAAQSALIDRAKQDQAVINSILNDERLRLKQLQNEVERSRKMARSATMLARRAAVAQQESKDIALREQTARLKSQESTRKAVSIARNAISALAAEERKHGGTRH